MKMVQHNIQYYSGLMLLNMSLEQKKCKTAWRYIKELKCIITAGSVQDARSVRCWDQVWLVWSKDMHTWCHDSLLFVWELLRLTVLLSSKANTDTLKQQTHVPPCDCTDPYGVSDWYWYWLLRIYTSPSMHPFIHYVLKVQLNKSI